MHHLLMYEVGPVYVERRAAFRDEHLALARKAQARGELIMCGALAEPVDGEVFIFRSSTAAEQFAAADPYVLHGLVSHWRVRPWITVIGAEIGTAVPGH